MISRLLLRVAQIGACLALAAAAPDEPIARSRLPAWTQRHEQKLAEIHQHQVDMIFLGDSITAELENTMPFAGDLNGVWKRFYACRNAVNLGFNGDTTNMVLWRIENGEVDGIDPKLAVLMIGTNNIRPKIQSTADGTVASIAALIAELHRRLPRTRILLLSIPPNNRTGATETERQQVNAALAARDWSGLNVTFQSIEPVLERGGAVDLSLFRPTRTGENMVHPNDHGWQKMAEAIEPTIERLLGEARHTGSVCSRA